MDGIFNPIVFAAIAIGFVCMLIGYLASKGLSKEEMEEICRDVAENRKETIGVM